MEPSGWVRKVPHPPGAGIVYASAPASRGLAKHAAPPPGFVPQAPRNPSPALHSNEEIGTYRGDGAGEAQTKQDGLTRPNTPKREGTL